jgi:hypothetical protein
MAKTNDFYGTAKEAAEKVGKEDSSRAEARSE